MRFKVFECIVQMYYSNNDAYLMPFDEEEEEGSESGNEDD